MADQRILPVILSGGSGTRLWPLSRKARPKQFIPLAGAETMLQLTAARVADANLFLPPAVVASRDHAGLVEEQLGGSLSSLILEPAPRNTAPAIALAALAAPAADQLLLAMPSDHLIRTPGDFVAAVRLAQAPAREGMLCTFGIRPRSPETAYGYIRRGAELSPGLFAGAGFVEKPDRATAEDYLREGCYDWNAGIFLFRADAYLEALERLAPEVLEASRAAFAVARREGSRLYPAEAAFSYSPSISIDYAVMEKADRLAVVPVDMDWSDVGSWDALHEVSGRDGEGNAVSGDVLAIGSRNSLLRSEGRKLVAIDVEDLIVIATEDAVLVVPRSASQRVKEAVAALQAGREDDLL